MPRILFKRARLGGLLSLLSVAVALGATHPGVALLLAPALALFAILLLGYTPGEHLIERMRARRFISRRTARAPRTLSVRLVVVVRRMMSPAASPLAMRPPPVTSALIS